MALLFMKYEEYHIMAEEQRQHCAGYRNPNVPCPNGNIHGTVYCGLHRYFEEFTNDQLGMIRIRNGTARHCPTCMKPHFGDRSRCQPCYEKERENHAKRQGGNI